jgi:hypothetical protein
MFMNIPLRQNARKIGLCALVCVLLLAACQPASTPTATPVEIIDPTDVVPTVIPTEVAPSPAPETPEATAILSNSIQVNGDLQADVEADNFYVAPVKTDDTVVGTMLYLSQEDTQVVFIRFPKDAQPGSYPISGGYTEDFDGTAATANYIDQTNDPALQFAASGGTLILVNAGDSYSGTFEFPATDESGKNVTVTGTFADLALPS